MARKAVSLAHDPKWKARVRKDLDASLKGRHRVSIRKLRGELARLKKAGIEELRRLRARCSEKLKKKIAGARDWYTHQRDQLRARWKARKVKARAECLAYQQKIRDQVVGRLAPVQAKLGEAHSALQLLVGSKAPPLAGVSGAPVDPKHRKIAAALRRGLAKQARIGASRGLTAAEARAESDEDAALEIAAHDAALLPIWLRVKDKINGGPHMSRAEEFLHMIHEDSALLEEAQAAQFEAGLRDLERRQLEEYMRQHPGEVANEAEPASGRRPRKAAAAPRKRAEKSSGSAIDYFDRLARGEAA